MKRRRLRRDELDLLLRDALSGDPPSADEDGQRSTMRAAWAALRASPRSGDERALSWLAVPASRTSPALGIAASLLAAGGLVLHLLQPPRLVAASLSVNNVSLRVASQLGRAVAMSSAVETRDDLGRVRRYRIEWRRPDAVTVALENADENATWSLTVPADGDGFGSAGPAPGGSLDSEPRLDPVRPLLSPDRVLGLLAGRWEAVGRDLEGRPTTFYVTGPRGRVRVTLDAATSLPLRLESGWTSILSFTPGEEASPPLAEAAASTRPGGSR